MSALERPSRDTRRRGRRRRLWPRVLLAVAFALVVFAAGVALGMAIEERPAPGGEQTIVRTFQP